ncbi:DUF4112 domain-containing protein [Rhizobiales bacterium RZME27]|jgi:hypothetical protein|uniref:DUF4112 domain-containing protein n=1 Tax=Endobacterium cereale TaxID=2663029 RepID=A0A6A8A2E2_9HYPH|nr:DUF4112 domain-containing protein [Endobacterium cereale]MEB2846000.1 DUF4112 domain-containing protein [Endobacterium cereale]MQY45262.1 DUF4112 domain-containing protein [Endobacterium cereale]
MPARTSNTFGNTAGNASGPGAGQDFADSAERLRRLRRLSGIARLMDTAIRIPGTGIRFGADSVMGLVPVIGDAGGAVIGLYIVNEARRMGVPTEKLAQMVGNIAVDSLVGSVPVFGDLFDVYFKSHRRNVDMIMQHFGVVPDDLHRER